MEVFHYLIIAKINNRLLMQHSTLISWWQQLISDTVVEILSLGNMFTSETMTSATYQQRERHVCHGAICIHL